MTLQTHGFWAFRLPSPVASGSGYDDRQTLGDKETGARVALPIWIDFMRTAIAGHPDEAFPGEAPITPVVAASLVPSATHPSPSNVH